MSGICHERTRDIRIINYNNYYAKKAILPDRLFVVFLYVIKPMLTYFSESLCNNSARAYITVCVISLTIGNLHSFQAGMYELEFACLVIGADHNTHMTDILTAAAACEEHQVSLAEMLAVNLLAICVLNT